MPLACECMHLQPVVSDDAGEIEGATNVPGKALQPETHENVQATVGQARVSEVVDLVLTGSLADEPKGVLAPADEPNSNEEQDVTVREWKRSETFGDAVREV